MAATIVFSTPDDSKFFYVPQVYDKGPTVQGVKIEVIVILFPLGKFFAFRLTNLSPPNHGVYIYNIV